MELQKRIRAFLLLQESLSEFIVNSESDLAFHNAIIKAQNQNPWFTYANTIIAIQGIAFYLQKSERQMYHNEKYIIHTSYTL